MVRRTMILLTTAVVALVVGIVAVQAFGAKPAEASLGPGGLVRVGLNELDGAARFADNFEDPARLLEDPARLEAEDAAKLTKDGRLRKVEKKVEKKAAARWTDGHGEPVGAAEEALKSKMEDNIEYVKKRGCEIVEVAELMEGLPPPDEQVRDMVEADVPAKYLELESEEGSSGFELKELWVESEGELYGPYLVVKRKQVKSELVEINRLVRQNMKASLEASYSSAYSSAEPDDVAFEFASEVASEMLSAVIDEVCE